MKNVLELQEKGINTHPICPLTEGEIADGYTLEQKGQSVWMKRNGWTIASWFLPAIWPHRYYEEDYRITRDNTDPNDPDGRDELRRLNGQGV